MANTIITKNSTVSGAVPGTGDVDVGELAINVEDRKMYTKNSSGDIIEIGGNSILTGGTTGQVLSKASDTDFDTEWTTVDVFPDQTSNSGKYLTTDGSTPSWDLIKASSLDGGQSGAAPIYACRAWVNFNGTGTVAIRASGNVSSITDNGTGDYTVNFTTALPDANYAIDCSADDTSTTYRTLIVGPIASSTPTASSCRFVAMNVGNNLRDGTYVSFKATR